MRRFFAIGNRDLSQLMDQDIQSNAKGMLLNACSHSSFKQKKNKKSVPARHRLTTAVIAEGAEIAGRFQIQVQLVNNGADAHRLPGAW